MPKGGFLRGGEGGKKRDGGEKKGTGRLFEEGGELKELARAASF